MLLMAIIPADDNESLVLGNRISNNAVGLFLQDSSRLLKSPVLCGQAINTADCFSHSAGNRFIVFSFL